MSWLQKLLPPRITSTPGVKKMAVPEGLWIKCPACEAVLYRTDLENNLHVCPKCGFHFPYLVEQPSSFAVFKDVAPEPLDGHHVAPVEREPASIG